MANQLCKLQAGIPEVMAEQLSLIFAVRIRGLEFECAKA